jgi:hypothetical protein
MTDEWWLRPPPKNADEDITELFEEMSKGVDDTYHAVSSAVSTLPKAYDTPEQLKERSSFQRGPSGRPLPPDGWSEPELTLPTKVATNLILVVPITTSC